jgi:alcohol dehydrogenase class IV
MASFQFGTATRILFGKDCLKQALPLAASLNILGKKALVVTGSNKLRAKPILALLDAKKIAYILYSVTGEPTVEMADEGTEFARINGVDFVIGYGGGSAIDTAKAIAALLANGGAAMNYLEVIGKGMPLLRPALPCIAIATTSGTGSEVTKNSVLKSEKHQQKVSLRSDFMYPTIAVVDPLLTIDVPASVTADTGLDAFTQCLEPFVSCDSNDLTDALAIKGLEAGARSLRAVYANGKDVDARTDMSLCSLMGGLALANAKLGAVHGFAGVVGGCTDAPHGAVCASLLPACILVNVKALQERAPTHPALNKYFVAARVVCRNANATPTDLAKWVVETCRLLNIKPISNYGMKSTMYAEVIKKSAGASSMKGNPIKLTDAELKWMLECACSPELIKDVSTIPSSSASASAAASIGASKL